MVETNLSKNASGFLVATRSQCATASLKSLGLEYETGGWWRHCFISYILSKMPKFLVRFASKNESKKIMDA
jgi:hypothetical protein